MKRYFCAGIFMLLTLSAAAQSLTVSQERVHTVFSAEQVSEIGITGGAMLTIGNMDYAVEDIDSIVVDDRQVPSQNVDVVWTAEGPVVTIAGDVAPWMTINVEGNHVMVTAAESLEDEVSYTLSGTARNASFTMEGSYKSTVVLNNLNLTSNNGPALNIMNGKRINIIVPEGTSSSFTDAAGGTHKAALFVNGHAEWSGAGSVTVKGLTKHAYASDEYTILGKDFGELIVTGAAGDGIHVKQYYDQQGGSVTINGCSGDGIDCEVTNDASDEYNGQMFISGGKISANIGSVGDVKAMKSENKMTITGGTITLTGSGDGQKGIKTGTDLLVQQASGSVVNIKITMTGGVYHEKQADESKTRGIKVDGDFTFNGGTITVTTGGTKSKDVAVDGIYTKISGTMNATVYEE